MNMPKNIPVETTIEIICWPKW